MVIQRLLKNKEFVKDQKSMTTFLCETKLIKWCKLSLMIMHTFLHKITSKEFSAADDVIVVDSVLKYPEVYCSLSPYIPR